MGRRIRERPMEVVGMRMAWYVQVMEWICIVYAEKSLACDV